MARQLWNRGQALLGVMVIAPTGSLGWWPDLPERLKHPIQLGRIAGKRSQHPRAPELGNALPSEAVRRSAQALHHGPHILGRGGWEHISTVEVGIIRRVDDLAQGSRTPAGR